MAESVAFRTKRRRWRMKRVRNGAAVKILRCSKPQKILGTASGTAYARLLLLKADDKNKYNRIGNARVAESADAHVWGACGATRTGSSPVSRTTLRRHFWYKATWEKPPNYRGFFFILAPILVFRATFQLLKSIKLRSVNHLQNNRLHQFLSLQVKKLVH